MPQVNIPKNFGSGSTVNHIKYGNGTCTGFVQGKYWRIEFESGEMHDFLPNNLFENLILEN